MLLAADGQEDGASLLNAPAPIRKKRKKRAAKNRQMKVNLRSSGTSYGTVVPSNGRVYLNRVGKAVTKMIIVDKVPFSFVEQEGFRKLMGFVCPTFEIPSRKTITEDCSELFLQEKKKLKEYILSNCDGRVSITINRWTCNQEYNYLCIAVQFVGEDWKLHKKVLNIRRLTNEKGYDIAGVIATCLEEWNLKNIFSVTIDDGSLNDKVVGYLREKIVTWGSSIAYGKYFHMRCVTRTVTMVVNDLLEEFGMAVARVREAITWVRASSVNRKKFKECVPADKIMSQKLLLDVPTRWNSTYFMLKAAENLEKPFKSLESLDPDFKMDLEAVNYKDEPIGAPGPAYWESVRHLLEYLTLFHDFLLASESSLVSDLFFRNLYAIFHHIHQMKGSDDEKTRTVASKIYAKVGKYWCEKEDTNMRMNRMFYIAMVFNPKHKMKYLKYAFKKLYGETRCEQLLHELNDELNELFEYYRRLHDAAKDSHQGSQSHSDSDSPIMERPRNMASYDDCFADYIAEAEAEAAARVKKSLENYLSDPREALALGVNGPECDVLTWWKFNGNSYPVLKDMARDIFSVAASAVPTEYAFSNGNQVLDSFKSNLTPQTMEALICTEDWIRSSKSSRTPEDDVEDGLDYLDERNELVNGLSLARGAMPTVSGDDGSQGGGENDICSSCRHIE